MQNEVKRILCIMCWIVGSITTVGAQDEFSIDLIDVRKGLLSNFVTKTVSDDKQLKYFATEAGISRFDGYRFKHYRPLAGDSGLVNENIETLLTSKQGFLWIGTKTGGLSRLNPKTQAIENWNAVFNPYTSKLLRIVSLAEDLKGNIWVGSGNLGCFKIDPNTRKVVEHFPSGRIIYSIICDAYGTVWFTDGIDLCSYKNEGGNLQRYSLSFTIYNLCEDTARKRIWMSGNVEKQVKLAWYDQLQDKINNVPLDMQARYVASMAIDSKMRIWLGSWGNGLYISDPSVSTFNKVKTSGFSGSVLNSNHNAITSINIDVNGIAWLGTSYGGVLVLYPNKGFRNISNNLDTYSDYNVTAIGEASPGKLLAGSISMGLFEIGMGDQPKFTNNLQLPPVRINQIYNKGEHYFFATNDGLHIFKNGFKGAPQRYFKGEKITTVLLSNSNELWAGTQQHGLLKIKYADAPDTTDITYYNEYANAQFQIENDRINNIVEDNSGNLWIATHSGLNLWDPESRRFISHSSLFGGKLAGVIVHDLVVNGTHMYMATPNGLYKILMNRQANKKILLEIAEHYNEESMLVNQFVCALEKDRNGNIWFSTTTGISKLNTHTGVLHHFGKQDGVQVNAFHILSSFSDSKGNIYFGGDNGMVFFNPEAVVAKYQKPTLVITGLNINNQPVETDPKNEKHQILKEAIQYTDRISLDYQGNHVALQFAANDFLGTENINYAYKLQPGNEDWVELRETNEASFTGLKPGNYTLSIKANRNNQGWGNPTVIHLHIASPPWMKWYAWLGYALVTAFIVSAIRKVRLRQYKLKTELQMVQFEKEKEHEINEAKINFFTNISHEFRTPLTLILSPSTELLAGTDLSQPQRQKISLIKSNAQKLLRLINQLLDFRKSEHGLLSLRPQSEEMRKMVQALINDFLPAARAKNIDLSLECAEAEIMVDIDRGQMEMAINNLLSNAIKFTPSNGKVVVRLHSDGSMFELKVKDNGIGIDAIHLEKIFNRFYQVQSEGGQQGGSGIGLAFAKNIVELHKGTISVESEPGSGTTFYLRIPVSQANGTKHETDPEEYLLEQEPEDALKPALNAAQHQGRPTVLVVDDNDDIRQYLKGLLEDEFEVLQADNGSTGHKLALETMPDLIISDVMMPQMNGIELCSELKHNMATSHIPVVLLTARASETYELSGLKTGADDYITKPFNPLIVQTRVRNMLDNRKKLKEYYLKKVRFEPEATGEKPENLDEIFLNKAIELVNENLQNEDLGIELMVDRLFMSQSTLFRKIKSLTGLSITGFIRALRLKKAAQLILQSNMKMSDVAYEVGFNDYKYFKKSFQQQFGCLPSEYREKQTPNVQNQG